MRQLFSLLGFAATTLALVSGCGDDTEAASSSSSAGGSASSGSSAVTTSSGDGGTGSSSGSGGSGGSSELALSGAVEKGPFILGSQITVSVLDASLTPTGDNFETETTSDLGEFSLDAVPAGPLAISGSGFYYNEILGELSHAELTLRALFVPSGGGPQTAYVNIVTHLTKQRVETLVGDGMAFDDAVAQAEQELQDELAITLASFDAQARGVEMNIAGGDTDANAYLFAVSSVLVQVVFDDGDGSVEARLQELLNTTATELASGALSSEIKTKVRSALGNLRIQRIANGFAARLEELDLPPVVPDMNRVLDQDGDGVVNVDDVCPLVADPGQEDEDDDGRGDACDACPDLDCATDCVPAAESATGFDVCVNLCDEDVDCLFGEACSPLGASEIGDVEICTTACDPDGDGSDCGEGYLCIADGADGVCQPREYREEGARCSNPLQCADGLACAAVYYEGDFACQRLCEGSDECAGAECREIHPLGGGTADACELVGGDLGDVCSPMTAGACAAGACGIGGACPESFFCCQAELGGVGEGCDGLTFECDAGLACAPNEALCPPPAEGFEDGWICCVPAGGLGEPCIDHDTCDDGLVCDPDDDSCGQSGECCVEPG